MLTQAPTNTGAGWCSVAVIDSFFKAPDGLGGVLTPMPSAGTGANPVVEGRIVGP
jgi:hypothetical protein